MTLLDAGREFARLTSGLAVPKEHVELVQCVLNNWLGRLNPVALNVWLSISDSARSMLDQTKLDRMHELLKFFEHTAEAARTGESPALASGRQKEGTLAADTDGDMEIVPLKRAGQPAVT